MHNLDDTFTTRANLPAYDTSVYGFFPLTWVEREEKKPLLECGEGEVSEVQGRKILADFRAESFGSTTVSGLHTLDNTYGNSSATETHNLLLLSEMNDNWTKEYIT